MANEGAAVLSKDGLDAASVILWHELGGAPHTFGAFGYKTERDLRCPSFDQSVLFEQFRNDHPELFDEGLKGIRACGEAGHIVAGGDPNRRLFVPFGMNAIWRHR
jgi:hypothetical protein